MRQYELTMVLRSKLDEKGRKKLLDNVKSWLKEAKITKEEEWGQKPLAYPIKKEIAGYYVMFQIQAEKLASDIEKRLIQTDEVLRHLLIRVN